jgi:hypothetical protein
MDDVSVLLGVIAFLALICVVLFGLLNEAQTIAGDAVNMGKYWKNETQTCVTNKQYLIQEFNQTLEAVLFLNRAGMCINRTYNERYCQLFCNLSS